MVTVFAIRKYKIYTIVLGKRSSKGVGFLLSSCIRQKKANAASWPY